MLLGTSIAVHPFECRTAAQVSHSILAEMPISSITSPGPSHDYLLPLSDLSTEFCTPVIIYHQIGNSRLTHLPSKSPFWLVNLFINGLFNLCRHLRIQDGFAHSWCGRLGLEVNVQRQPERLHRSVLTNSLTNTGKRNRVN